MATKAVSEKSLVVLNFLKENVGKNMTAADISAALGGDEAGFGVKTINGVVTRGLAAKEPSLAQRTPATIEVETEDGNKVSKEVKFISATEDGIAYDHDAALAEDAAAKAPKAE